MQSTAQPMVTGLGGSLRAASRSRAVLSYALSLAVAKGAATTLVDLHEASLPMFDPEVEPERREPAVIGYLKRIRACDALVIASPVYAASVSGLVKNALDFLHDNPGGLAGRAVGLIAVGAGGGAASGTISALRETCRGMGAWVEPRSVIALERGIGVDGTIYDPVIRDQVRLLVNRVLDATNRTQQAASHLDGAGVKVS